MVTETNVYGPRYPVSTCVRIADSEALQQFLEAWQFHHPLSPDQLRFAGSLARVRDVGFYHGGDRLYHLEGVPGTWHEQLLLPTTDDEAASVPFLAGGAYSLRLLSATLLGFLVALTVGGALYFGLMLLGAVTGVIAMCSTAPDWWAYAFFGLLLVCPLAGGVYAGTRVSKWYCRRV